MREVEMKSLHGRKIAIDASMALYQFLIAIRSSAHNGQQSFQLTNEAGETTSHIQGMFNRTIRYLTEGIKPVFVFDGKPPTMKSGELLKRREKRSQAQAAMAVAVESQNVPEMDKQAKRLVRASTKDSTDCMRLLTLMGVPVVAAPCEAEAQAAHLAKTGLVYAVGTEDMDALTFATPVLVRKLTFAGSGSSNGSKAALVQTINYAKAVAGLNLTHHQFVDLCILLGCDYCDTIRGVGPKTALKLLREHGSIEGILAKIDTQKYAVPPSWIPPKPQQKINSKDDEESEHDEESPPDLEANPNENEDNDDDTEFIPAFVQARQLFHNHEVLPEPPVLKWKPCQVPELTAFLVDEMGFDASRVASSIVKLQAAHKAHAKPQSRLDSFFTTKAPPTKTVTPSNKSAAAATGSSNNKRKPAVNKTGRPAKRR